VVRTDPLHNNGRLPLLEYSSRRLYRSNYREQDDPDYADMYFVDYPIGYRRGSDALDMWLDLGWKWGRHSLKMTLAWLQQGDKERAVKALTKCEKELPYTTIPLTITDLEMADLWLGVGNTQHALDIYAQIAEESISYLEWANTLSSGRLAGNASECASNLRTLYICINMLKENNSPKEKAISEKFNSIAESSAAITGWSYLERITQQNAAVQ